VTPHDSMPDTPMPDGLAADDPIRSDPPLRVQRLRDDVVLPTRAHPDDAGLDLRAAESVDLAPGARVAVPTGLVVAIPSGSVGLVHPRSGLALRDGITVVNAPGTIDAGYRGEVLVALVNVSDTTVRVRRGDRIAQLLVQSVALPTVVEATDLQDQATGRGAGGFGSTGRA